MLIKLILRMFLGYVRIQVEGYYIERFINICTNRKILIWNLKRKKGVQLFLNIGIKDFKKLTDISIKTNSYYTNDRAIYTFNFIPCCKFKRA